MPVGTVFRTAVQFRPAPPYLSIVSRRLLLAGCLALSLGTARDTIVATSPSRSVVLWAWERPEDLRFLTGTSVAFLDRTLVFDDRSVTPLKRRQPLRLSPSTPLIAVVRIEGRAPLRDDIRSRLVSEILESARVPGVTMVQIDFDAVRSQRQSYLELLREARPQLPTTVRLSITALASWCTDDPWIDASTVDEIVPMLFRMGPEARRVTTRFREYGRWPVAECNSAVGVSLDEPWNGLPAATRAYVFNPRPWRSADWTAAQRFLRD